MREIQEVPVKGQNFPLIQLVMWQNITGLASSILDLWPKVYFETFHYVTITKVGLSSFISKRSNSHQNFCVCHDVQTLGFHPRP